MPSRSSTPAQGCQLRSLRSGWPRQSVFNLCETSIFFRPPHHNMPEVSDREQAPISAVCDHPSMKGPDLIAGVSRSVTSRNAATKVHPLFNSGPISRICASVNFANLDNFLRFLDYYRIHLKDARLGHRTLPHGYSVLRSSFGYMVANA